MRTSLFFASCFHFPDVDHLVYCIPKLHMNSICLPVCFLIFTPHKQWCQTDAPMLNVEVETSAASGEKKKKQKKQNSPPRDAGQDVISETRGGTSSLPRYYSCMITISEMFDSTHNCHRFPWSSQLVTKGDYLMFWQHPNCTTGLGAFSCTEYWSIFKRADHKQSWPSKPP